MIVEKEFLSKIKDLGINSYEAKLWTAILSRGIATAGELSDIANVPRSRSYDVLESLERKGFIVMKLGKPIKYIAVPPNEVIERVKQRIKDDAQQKDKMLDSIKESEALKRLHLLFTRGSEQIEPGEITGVIKDRKNVISHIYSSLKRAEKFIYTMSCDDEFIHDLRKGFAKAIKKGIKVKIISPNKPNIPQVESKQKMVKSRFVLIDGKEVIMLPVNVVDDHSDFAVWIKNESFTKNFEEMFIKTW